MRVFITGATGFIGSHLAVALARAGHQVTASSREPGKLPALAQVPGVRVERLDLAQGKDLAQLLKGHDALVHVALLWGEDGPSMLARDAAASIALFEACVAAGVPRVIYTSSTAANGEMGASNREDRQPRPIDFYGATKAATEQFARAYSHQHALQIQVIRPGYIFGEPVLPGARSQPDRRFHLLGQKIKNRQSIELDRNDGTQFLHAEDLTSIYIKLLQHDARHSIHYALGAEWQSWEQVARWGMELAGCEAPISLLEKGYGGEPFLFDVSAIERDFGLRFLNQARLKAHLAWELKREPEPAAGNIYMSSKPGFARRLMRLIRKSATND